MTIVTRGPEPPAVIDAGLDTARVSQYGDRIRLVPIPGALVVATGSDRVVALG